MGTHTLTGDGGDMAMESVREKFQGLLRELFPFDAEAAWVKAEKLTEGAAEVFLNADHALEGARVLDPVFRDRMFAPVSV